MHSHNFFQPAPTSAPDSKEDKKLSPQIPVQPPAVVHHIQTLQGHPGHYVAVSSSPLPTGTAAPAPAPAPGHQIG